MPNHPLTKLPPENTETIDKLFLELSQVTNATTWRTVRLEETLVALRVQLNELSSQILIPPNNVFKKMVEKIDEALK